MLPPPRVDPCASHRVDDPTSLAPLFHRLNNQLGIILANAELLEAKATDPGHRSRASQLVASALEAMSTARVIRDRAEELLRRQEP